MKKFEVPEIEVQNFKVEDVVTTSSSGSGGAGDDSGAVVPGSGGAWGEELPR